MPGTDHALMECANPRCCFPQGGQAVIPSIDSEAPFDAAQTDWPICDTCLEPLTLAEVVDVDDKFLLALAQEAFEYYDLEGLRKLRLLCQELIDAGEGRRGVDHKPGARSHRLPLSGGIMLPQRGCDF